MKKSVGSLSKEIERLKKFSIATFSLTVVNSAVLIYLFLNI